MPNDPSSQPTQPLTDAELAEMDRKLTDATDRDGELYLVTDAPKDMRRLLGEVDRLRAELHEAHRTVSAEEGRAAALETVYRQTRTERDVRSAEIERLRAENTELEADRDKYQNWYDAACAEVAEAYRSRNEED